MLNRNRFLLFDLETVHAHNDCILLIDLLLVFIGGVLDFLLHVAALDGFQHSAENFDFAQIFGCAFFNFAGQGFDVIGSGEWINGLRRARFVGDDLLGAQGDSGRLLCGQGQSFVERVGVQRLASAQHSGQCLDRGTHDVVFRLLGG